MLATVLQPVRRRCLRSPMACLRPRVVDQINVGQADHSIAAYPFVCKLVLRSLQRDDLELCQQLPLESGLL